MPPELLLAVAAALPFLGSIVAICLPSDARGTAAGVAGFVTLASLACLAWLHPLASGPEPVTFALDWLPSLGVRFDLRLDGRTGMVLVGQVGGGLSLQWWTRSGVPVTAP